MVTLGIDRLLNEPNLINKYKGQKIALLCHSASTTQDLRHSVEVFTELFKENFIKIFGPQHGLVSDVQDNMVESDHYQHPYFKRPVYSLYSETRSPTPEMLADIDTIFVDLQDVGTRVYTYISTLGLLMEQCEKSNIKVVVLDRPNPVGGEIIEGNVLEKQWRSFVGHYEIPQRHAMTMGEIAHFAKQELYPRCDLEVIEMKGWQRSMFFTDTALQWVNPSPNLPTPSGAITFAGTVLFEGTNISEGRGTTRSLEILGHPKIEAFSFVDRLNQAFKDTDLQGFYLRPTVFMPTFQKHQGKACGGVQIHVTAPNHFKSWSVSQIICRELYHQLKDEFEWNKNPYEYEFDRMAIDFINGSEKVRNWVEAGGDHLELKDIEKLGQNKFLEKRKPCLIYN